MALSQHHRSKHPHTVTLLAAFPVILLAAGCAPPPAGTWTGSLACGDEDASGTIQIDLGLGRDDATHFSGPGTMSFSGSFEINGSWQDYQEDIDYDATTLELSQKSGSQDVNLTGTATTCQTWIDAQLSSSECTGGDDLDMPLSWNGADLLTVDQGDCSGSLSRS